MANLSMPGQIYELELYFGWRSCESFYCYKFKASSFSILILLKYFDYIFRLFTKNFKQSKPEMIIRQISFLKNLQGPTQNFPSTKTSLTTFTSKNFSRLLTAHKNLLLPSFSTKFHQKKYFSTGSNIPPKDFDISKIESLQRLKEQKLYQDSSKHNAELASLEHKAEMLEQSKPSHDQFIFFDPDIMANIPWIFSWITPYVDFVRNLLLSFTDYTGLPYWVPITMLCLTLRSSLLPLTLIQMRKISEIGKTAPVMAQVKRAADLSTLPKATRYWRIFRAFCNLSKAMKLRPMLLFSFNIIHIPFLITNVWVIRTSLAEPLLRETSLSDYLGHCGEIYHS